LILCICVCMYVCVCVCVCVLCGDGRSSRVALKTLLYSITQ
jgi:hypothetical protein